MCLLWILRGMVYVVDVGVICWVSGKSFNIQIKMSKSNVSEFRECSVLSSLNTALIVVLTIGMTATRSLLLVLLPF